MNYIDKEDRFLRPVNKLSKTQYDTEPDAEDENKIPVVPSVSALRAKKNHLKSFGRN